MAGCNQARFQHANYCWSEKCCDKLNINRKTMMDRNELSNTSKFEIKLAFKRIIKFDNKFMSSSKIDNSCPYLSVADHTLSTP